MIAWTGKGGKINFEVALHKAMIEMSEDLKKK
jgi:hypothetical protein